MDKTAFKVIATVVLILLGTILAIVATPPSGISYTKGILMDFGDYDI